MCLDQWLMALRMCIENLYIHSFENLQYREVNTCSMCREVSKSYNCFWKCIEKFTLTVAILKNKHIGKYSEHCFDV